MWKTAFKKYEGIWSAHFTLLFHNKVSCHLTVESVFRFMANYISGAQIMLYPKGRQNQPEIIATLFLLAALFLSFQHFDDGFHS